ncbi:hypothetical protein Tco_0725398 [Tanacetum coccineum]|uniref:Uncharacterized protein n=1 Tax=Tanacetum coccineum TaxID=301880 RepID=A0ABQ4YEX4_9ASTR
MATPIDFSKYVLNRLKIDNLTQDILLGPTYNLLKGTYTSNIELEYHFQECHPCHLTVAADYFFYNDLEYLKSSNPERTYTKSIMKTKAARYEIEGIEDMKILGVKSVNGKKQHEYGHLEDIVVKRADRQFYKFKEEVIKKHELNITPPQQTIPEIEFKELYTPSHKPPGVIYEDLTKQKRVVRANKLYKFSNGTLKKVQDELHHKMRERRIIQNLERLVGARELKMDYKLMTRTT